jgi:hypothetical protein
VITVFKIQEGRSNVPVYFDKYQLSSSRTNTIPILDLKRARCVRAGPESLIIGSENLHLVKMVSK